MGNLRFGFKAILGITLLFSTIPNNYVQAKACRGFFADIASEASFNQSATLSENSRLKVVTWNMLNFRIRESENTSKSSDLKKSLAQKFSNVSFLKNKKNGFDKSEAQLQNYRKIMQELDADVYVFQEVLGIKSLQFFMQKYMNDKYDVHLVRGNDDRAIQIAFAVKKSLEVEVETQSHKDMTWTNPQTGQLYEQPIFSRDLPALYLRQKDGSNSRASADPDLIILGTHFKSKRDTDGDPESHDIRTSQVQAAAQVIKSLDQKYNRKVPLMLAGDFNTDVMKSNETQSLRFVLKDSLDLMGNKLSTDDKVTQTYHPFEGRMDAHQYDAQLLNDNLSKKLIDSYVYRYKDEFGKPKVYTNNYGERKLYPLLFKQRKKNPSDHMPVIGIYDMTR